MIPDALLETARALWEELSLTRASYAAGAGDGVEIAVGPNSRLCPPGWVGIVALGGSAIATAPDRPTAELLRTAWAGHPVAALTELETLRGLLPVAEALGPATLAYLDAADFRPASDVPPGVAFAVRPADHPDIRTLLAAVSEDEADESGIEYATSPVFVAFVDGVPAAACGYRDWLGRAAHFGVLTSAAHRDRGLARAAAGRAAGHALAAGLLPQWRARPDASRAVARRLGFRELGVQVSFRLEPPAVRA